MTIILGILLALGCALATNLGFLYKHRGACQVPAVDFRRPLRSARQLFGSRLFLVGFVIGSGAWLFHVAAMAVAPLSLVQAVLAGGVVLLAVMAERMFGLCIGRRQWTGLAAMAIGLAMLGITLPAAHGAHSRFSAWGMLGFQAALVLAVGMLVIAPRWGARRHHHGLMFAGAAGILFGVSDVAVKAVSGMVSSGSTAVLAGLLALGVGASVTSFYASARGFQTGEAVPVIALIGTAANLVGIVGGIVVFGDPLAATAPGVTLECLAFALVLVSAWLMPAPVRMMSPSPSALAA